MARRLLLVAALAVATALLVGAVPLEKPGRINDLPGYGFFQPEKIPQVPVLIGERRCDNYYHGGHILPCLLRPQLPPFSYSTESAYNMEYKKK